MAFSIAMGIPEMLSFWESLQFKIESGTSTKVEAKTYKLLRKTLSQLSSDPRYPGLHTHEIDELTARYGVKVFQSYVENRNPRAMRIYWVYGPKQNFITVIGIEPHPNDAKSNAYKKVRLSQMGQIEP